MQIFDIVEELEKERKKNKELEERIQFVVYKNNELLDRILKAIEYNKKVLTWTTNEEITDEIANENLSILKGDNK